MIREPGSDWTSRWTRWWEIRFLRIDALSLRERGFLFASVLACCAALLNYVWLSPAQLAYAQSAQLFKKQSAALQRDREALYLVARPEEVAKGVRDESTTVKVRLETVNRAIQEHLRAANTNADLEQVLVHLLRRHDGLKLVRTVVSAPEKSGKSAAQPLSGVVAASLVTNLSAQSVVLTVSGTYPALVGYVQALEAELPTVRWDSMALKGAAGQSELTLRLSLIGVQP